MDKENIEINKRGRPKKYFCEEEYKAANKQYNKTYWSKKDKDDEVIKNQREKFKNWYYEKMKDPEYAQKERDRKKKYNINIRNQLKELKELKEKMSQKE